MDSLSSEAKMRSIRDEVELKVCTCENGMMHGHLFQWMIKMKAFMYLKEIN